MTYGASSNTYDDNNNRLLKLVVSEIDRLTLTGLVLSNGVALLTLSRITETRSSRVALQAVRRTRCIYTQLYSYFTIVSVLILVLLLVSFITVMFRVGYPISPTYSCFTVFLSLYVRKF